MAEGLPAGLPDRVRWHPSQVDSAGPVPRRLLDSWQRSEDYGVPLEAVEPVFAGTDGVGSLFYECGTEVLSDLHESLGTEPVSLMLTDADGIVLNRLTGEHSLARALDAVHLAPGFAYSERTVGTNGLGLALADRTPTLVRADQHYALSLCTFTCAAVPVLDPTTGRLEGAVNLTTWSQSSSDLLLALARSAASNTAALMLARSHGRRQRQTPRGQVFRVEMPRVDGRAGAGSGSLRAPSALWDNAVRRAQQEMAAGKVVAALGEPGSGRATLLGQAARLTHPRDRILSASAPGATDVETWFGLWAPELGKDHTAIIVRDVDALPAWVAGRLRDLVAGQANSPVRLAVTATRFEDVPAPLAALVDSVVTVAPLRERAGDIMPLALHLAARARGREVRFSRAAERALQAFDWPGNVEQLARMVAHAANRGDVVDVANLPPEVLSDSTRRLSRIEAFERGEILRVLTSSTARGAITMAEAATELGMSRATLYRKISQYGIHIPRA